MFGGRLTQDFVAERLGHSSFVEIKELDLPNCSLRTVDLGVGDQFINLRRYLALYILPHWIHTVYCIISFYSIFQCQP